MATIDIRIQRIEQLFDSLEPSPFRENEKALSRDAESYIVESAGGHGRAAPLRLVVHAPVSIKPHAAEIARAVHAHFELARVHSKRRNDRAGGRRAAGLAGADAVMTTSALLRHGVAHMRTLVDGLSALLAARGIGRLDEVRGRMSRARLPEPGALERAHYVRMLQGYTAG